MLRSLVFIVLLTSCLGQKVSKMKCEEYAALAKASDMTCGQGQMFDANSDFPSSAVLGYTAATPLSEFPCEAVLISPDTLMAPAHCLDQQKLGSLKWARLGSTGLYVFISEVAINRTIIHPKYSPPSTDNDIALFKLKESLNSSFVPACVDTQGVKVGSEGVGVGRVYTGPAVYKGALENYPTKAMLKVQPPQDCKKAYVKRTFSSDTTLCVKDPKSGPGDCLSGSLYVSRQSCIQTVVGLASFGAMCLTETPVGRMPVVYTLVSAYLPWIESVTWPTIK